MAAGDVEVNITTPNARAGLFFDGISDVITRTELDTIGVTQPFSCSFDVLVDDTTTQQSIILNGRSANDRFGLEIESDEIQASCYNGSDWRGEASTPFTSNKWSNILYTFDGVNAGLVYVDGVLNAQGVNHPSTSVSGLDVGGSAGRFFKGALSNIQMWDRVLEPIECLAVADGDIIADGLIHKWKLESDYVDIIGGKDFTPTGTRFGIGEGAIGDVLQTKRKTANDVFLIADVANKQILTTVLEES